MALLAVPPVYQALALFCTLLGWPVPMFSYLYDRMHKRNWMTLKTQKTARPASPKCGQ